MPVPSTLADLDPVAANNSPPGSEATGANVDNYLRAHAAFIAQLEANKIDTTDADADYQPKDALLTAIAAQTTAANKVQAFSGVDTVTLLDFKDEYDMASNSATAIPSQQSVKAYVGTYVTAAVAATYPTRAWVNFNGTGTVTIRGSGNVSSITYNGTGDYTVNFTTPMPDANYAANISLGMSISAQAAIIGTTADIAPTASALRFSVHNAATGVIQDSEYIMVSIVR